MKQKIFIAIIVFILVVSVFGIGKYSRSNDYFEKLVGYDKYLVLTEQDVDDRGFVVEVFDALKLTDFIHFCNSLPQKLDFMGMIYILSIGFLSLRLYFQKLFNRHNIAVKFPILSIFCLIVYALVSFTFTNNINAIDVFFIYSIIMLTIELVTLLLQNYKNSIIPEEDYNLLDNYKKPLYFTAMSRKKLHNLDMILAGIVFLTVKGILTIPIIYVIFGTIPYSIYGYVQILKAKQIYPIVESN